MRACARLYAETGLSVHIHTDPNIRGEDVVATAKLAIECGAEPDKVHICHMDNRIAKDVPVDSYLSKPEVDRTLNLDTHKELLDLGVTIGLDTWGMPITNDHFFMPDDFERLKALITLCDLGYADQITLDVLLGGEMNSTAEVKLTNVRLTSAIFLFFHAARRLLKTDVFLRLFCENSAICGVFLFSEARYLHPSHFKAHSAPNSLYCTW